MAQLEGDESGGEGKPQIDEFVIAREGCQPLTSQHLVQRRKIYAIRSQVHQVMIRNQCHFQSTGLDQRQLVVGMKTRETCQYIAQSEVCVEMDFDDKMAK